MPREALTVVRSLRDEVEDLAPGERRALDWVARRLAIEVAALCGAARSTTNGGGR